MKTIGRVPVGEFGSRRQHWFHIPVLVVCLAMSGMFASATTWAQPAPANAEDRQLDAALQSEIIDSIAAALNEIYVFPEVAEKMVQNMRRKLKDKDYQDLTGCREFTGQLTEDMKEISKDGHLHCHFASEELIQMQTGDTLTDDARRQELEEARSMNFGFKTVQLLPGNVGYLDFRNFSGLPEAGPTAVAAMNFLAYADAIIFDMRENGGGSPTMIQLLTSYLLDEPTHLNSFYIRKEDTIKQFWTHNWVPGPRMPDVDVYVLTSEYTFSGAEEFTYNLKNLERATIIGETTGGGAHPTDRRLFANLNVWISVPFGRAINPITGTNWEGTGVTPHIEVPREKALDVAYMKALEKLLKETDDPRRQGTYQWVIDGKKVLLEPVTVEVSALQDYVGSYGPRQIRLENDQLVYQREERPPYRLTPMGDDRFLAGDLEYFRIQFVRDDAGQVVKLVGQYDNGRTDSHERDK
ncbi:MAG: S41 family peptidase [bacterium]